MRFHALPRGPAGTQPLAPAPSGRAVGINSHEQPMVMIPVALLTATRRLVGLCVPEVVRTALLSAAVFLTLALGADPERQEGNDGRPRAPQPADERSPAASA